MKLLVELIPDPDLGGFTACIPDIPAYGEGKTEEEAIADLRESLRAFIEAVGLEEAVARLRAPAVFREMDLDLSELSHG